MSQLQDLTYTQSLWKIQPPTNPAPAAASRLNTESTRQAKPPKLSQQIHIRNPNIQDLSPEGYWLNPTLESSGNTTVTVLVGDLHRDRIWDKSCVLFAPGSPRLIILVYISWNC
jgi:hypothetical protein